MKYLILFGFISLISSSVFASDKACDVMIDSGCYKVEVFCPYDKDDIFWIDGPSLKYLTPIAVDTNQVLDVDIIKMVVKNDPTVLNNCEEEDLEIFSSTDYAQIGL